MPAPENGPFPTLMVNTFLVARRNAPDAQVRALLEGIYSPTFRYAAHLAELDELRGRISQLAPLHPAAAAWYARHEPLSTDRFEIASFFLAGLVTLASATQYLISRRRWFHSLRSRRAIRRYFERLLEYGAAVEATSDTTGLNAILHDMMSIQREAETEWLAGRLDTEHMENLYLIYNTRTRNAFDKIHQLHLKALIEGTPLPTTYHPEPARVVLTRPVAEAPRPMIFDTPPSTPAEPVATAGSDDPATWSRVRVASKYPNIARRHFAGRGVQAEVVHLNGAMELAPALGLPPEPPGLPVADVGARQLWWILTAGATAAAEVGWAPRTQPATLEPVRASPRGGGHAPGALLNSAKGATRGGSCDTEHARRDCGTHPSWLVAPGRTPQAAA